MRKDMQWLAVAILLSACASTPATLSRLDSGGLTVVALSEPVLLSHPVPALAAAARDYAYIGPVEINRMGVRRHYFWVGLATTVDRERPGLEPAGAVTLVLMVDGEAMTFPLAEWTMDLDATPYGAKAPVYATLAAQASLDQIRRIAQADAVAMQIVDEHGATSRYTVWEGRWSDWAALPDGS